MNNLTILVATEDEKRALIPPEYYDNVFITGIGIINIIKTLKDTKFDGTIINIGYADATSNIKVGEVCFVNNSYCYRNIYNNLDSIKVNTLEVQGVKCVSCATSMDFVADSKHTNTLFDMELRAILEFYNDCYSIKIVSDNGCMEDYDNALSHDYKHIIKEIIDKLYKI